MNKYQEALDKANKCSDGLDCIECKYNESCANGESWYKTLKELVDEKINNPTLEQVKKEWEELGYEIVEDNQIRLILKCGLSTIQISKITKVYRKIIGHKEDSKANFLTLQEHQLLTKTFKALGWEM